MKKAIKIIIIFLIMAPVFSGCYASEAEPYEQHCTATPIVSVSVTSTPVMEAEPTEYKFDKNNPDYREAMRQWVMLISTIAKEKNPNFNIIPQNCSPLFTDTGYADGELSTEFINSIDGTGQEGISFGYDRYNNAMDNEMKERFTSLLNLGVNNGLTVLSINYCDRAEKIESAVEYDRENGYLSFISPSFSLTDIPSIINENSKDITQLNDAENWLCLLNPEKYGTKEKYINALIRTNYDILVIDAFFYEKGMLMPEDVNALKVKDNGGKRLVIAYLSIGEAEDYRYYWQQEHNDNPPEWMLDENPNWEGNYPVKYWHEDWQSIIATDEDSYLNRIVDAGFDGVYLDIVDGYQAFEDMAEK